MRLNTDLLVGFGGVIVGLIGIGYVMGSQKKLNNVCGIVDKVIDDILDGVDIEDDIHREVKIILDVS